MAGLSKISVSIRGHRTSVSLEPEFVDALRRIAAARGISLAALVTHIDQRRSPGQNLSSALRVFVLDASQSVGKNSVR